MLLPFCYPPEGYKDQVGNVAWRVTEMLLFCYSSTTCLLPFPSRIVVFCGRYTSRQVTVTGDPRAVVKARPTAVSYPPR